MELVPLATVCPCPCPPFPLTEEVSKGGAVVVEMLTMDVPLVEPFD